MADVMTESPVAIKWRDDPEAERVTCWLAPTDEPDRTDEWVPIMCVNRVLLDDDPQLYEDLLKTANEWLLRIFESAGVTGIKMLRFPGGMPSMDGAS